MLVDERRANLVEIAELSGFVSLQHLVEELGASESTIRRDLEFLDGLGQIRKTRGGAAYIGESLSGFEDRRQDASAEKRSVATAVANMIEPDETILLDGGTTTLEVARRLIGKSLQVVTNSLPIANLFVNQSEIELIFVGGYLYPKTGVALGPHAVDTLRNIKARRLVMSVAGITEQGLFNSNALLVETERQMIESSDEVIVASDSSKFGRSALAPICSLDRVNRFVVDSGISPEWRERIDQAGVELKTADAG